MAAEKKCQRNFERFGSALFLIFAVLGAAHVLGPTSEQSFFGTRLWFDWSEVIFFACLGLFLLLLQLLKPYSSRPLVLCVGWFIIAISIWSLFSRSLFSMHLEWPVEGIMFFLLGLFAEASGLCMDEGQGPGKQNF